MQNVVGKTYSTTVGVSVIFKFSFVLIAYDLFRYVINKHYEFSGKKMIFLKS